jgi:hypothetical protein
MPRPASGDHLFNAMFDAGDAPAGGAYRHEQGAAYMALGAALATAKLRLLRGARSRFSQQHAALATAYSIGASSAHRPDPSRGIGKVMASPRNSDRSVSCVD